MPEKMTLQSAVERGLAFYTQRGHGADSWQWKDEGLPYAVGDYLSSYEMTEADWAYARLHSLEEEVNFWLHHNETEA